MTKCNIIIIKQIPSIGLQAHKLLQPGTTDGNEIHRSSVVIKFSFHRLSKARTYFESLLALETFSKAIVKFQLNICSFSSLKWSHLIEIMME